MRALSATVLLSCLALLASASAQAAVPCGDAVLRDWADGAIEARYAPRCYGDALDGLPEDVRAYSTAADDIAQALRTRIRELRARAPGRQTGPSPTGGTLAVPMLVLSGAAVALVLGLAGLGISVGRRLLRDGPPHRGTRPIGQL
jgi:hypothetical protein